MPDRGHHDKVLAEVFIDRFRLGGRFDYDEILWHYLFKSVTHRCLFDERGLLLNHFPEVFRSELENNTKYALNAKHPLLPAGERTVKSVLSTRQTLPFRSLEQYVKALSASRYLSHLRH